MSPPGYSLSRARRLLRSRHRRGSGLFLADGPHLLLEALRAGRTPLQVFVRTGDLSAGCAAALEEARAAGVPEQDVDERELASLADTRTPQGLVAVVPIPAVPPAPFSAPGLWLLLDGVADPGNAGTLLRAADAFGAVGALALRRTVDLWSAKTLRAGQGAHMRLALLQDDAAGRPATSARLVEFLAAGGEVWAADRDGESVYAAPPPPPLLMLAVGNEARGLSPETSRAAARVVGVPHAGCADSLNVAMAGTVLLSWLARSARHARGAG